MAKLKVYGGYVMSGRKQYRAVIATTGKMKAIDALKKYGISYWVFNSHWCETGNELELSTALANPGKLFLAEKLMSKVFVEDSNV